MINFNFIKTRDIWRYFPNNLHVHQNFNIFLEEVKKIKGKYFNDAVSLCDYLPGKISNTREYFTILYQLGFIHENHTYQECWVDRNIDVIESHKDIINIVEKEIDINQFIRKRKLKNLTDGIKH